MIELQEVVKSYPSPGGPRAAVDKVSLRIEAGQTLALIGTSGSGKTTALKLINRLEEPTSGRVLVDGRDVQGEDVYRLRRTMGYVIQQGGLFPHRTVAENVALLPSLERWPPDRLRRRVEELLELVGLPSQDYGRRYPHELSGGQQQRVGIARALALDPPLLLMDEPFGALDPITREGLRQEFLRWKRSSPRTVVLVTHDLAEAFQLGDRVALMDRGRLVQFGTPRQLQEQPATDWAREFLQLQAPPAAVEPQRPTEGDHP